MKRVIVLSGGLDSTTLLAHQAMQAEESNLIGEPTELVAVAFNYGQRHADKELSCAMWQANYYTVPLEIFDVRTLAAQIMSSSALVNRGIEVPKIVDAMGDPQPLSYVPNRNLIFLEIATAYAESVGAYAVYYGAQKHDMYGYWDTTAEFLQRVNAIHSLNRKHRIYVEAPFINASKAKVLDQGLRIGVRYEHTWSCYNGRDKACGTCPTCAERIKAFIENDAVDPLEYEIAIDWGVR